MSLAQQVDEIHNILVTYTRQRTASSGGLFSRMGSMIILLLILSAGALWTGAIMTWPWLLGVGLVLLAGVLLTMGVSAFRELGNPGSQMTTSLKARASVEIALLEQLNTSSVPALTEVETLLNQRIAAIEAGMAFLLGGLKTAGLLGSLAVMLGAWSALTSAFPSLKPFSYLFGGVVVGVLSAGERLESGLESLRRNRDLVSRALIVRKLPPQ